MKIGFACGVFDLFHAGHVLMLKECKENCDFLVVGLNSCENIDYIVNPGKSKPVFSLANRKLIVESCRYVDEVIVYSSEEELENILRTREFDIRFLGEDYKGKKITGAKFVKELYFINRDHGMSSSKFKDHIWLNNKK